MKNLMRSAALLLCVIAIPNLVMAQQTYVGSESCKQCHEDNWNLFRVSGHPYKLHKRVDVETWPVPLPSGYEWDDISYVIGGWGWKIRYMDLDGYIITESPPGNAGNNQYNLATGDWVDYHAGEVMKPYDCGACHTTGFDPLGNQDGLVGIEGTWAFEGVQCEACHGPASDHIDFPTKQNITVDTSSEACGQCHVRGDPMTEIPASGGFVKHHEQYNEILASGHAQLDCVECHNPHAKSEFSIHTTCIDCHEGYADVKKAFKKLGKKHIEFGLECHDCHMPYAAKSAVAFNNYKGDVRSHQFSISTDKNAEMFSPDGKNALGTLTAEFVCLSCHTNITDKFTAKGKPQNAVTWARKMVKKIHKKVPD